MHRVWGAERHKLFAIFALFIHCLYFPVIFPTPFKVFKLFWAHSKSLKICWNPSLLPEFLGIFWAFNFYFSVAKMLKPLESFDRELYNFSEIFATNWFNFMHTAVELVEGTCWALFAGTWSAFGSLSIWYILWRWQWSEQ